MSLVLAVSGVTACAVLGPQAGAEAEARQAFIKLHRAAKEKRADQFKQLIAAADVQEMESMEREKAGFIELVMSLVAEHDPAEFTAEVQGEQVNFVRRVSDHSEGGSGTSTTTVRMLREDGQWKFGKPRP
jgi:chromosome condensin MukBEF ATPase and DNA-binding subunit MukB